MRVPVGTEYVLVGGGTADLCGPKVLAVDDMATVATFRSVFRRAAHVLRRRLPRARILVVSIPNWTALLESDTLARRPRPDNTCPLLFGDAADARTAAAVAARVRGYNAAMRAVCERLGDACRFDGYAVYRLRLTPEDLSRVDWLHPSVRGQARIAAVAWRVGRFPWGVGVDTPCPVDRCASVSATVRADESVVLRVRVVDAASGRRVSLLPGSRVGFAVAGRRRSSLEGDALGSTRLDVRIAAAARPRRYVIVVHARTAIGEGTLRIPFRA
jgi:hypothetical protein